MQKLSLAILIFVALLGFGFAQDLKDSKDSHTDSQNQKSANSSANHNDSHQTSSEWEMLDFVKGSEVERKKEALTSCYKTQNSTQNCAKILSDWESLCAYNGTKYCLALYVIYAEIYESLHKDKESLNKTIATLKQYCEGNDANACLALGESYAINEAGLKKGLPYFQKACDLGASMGCEFIVSRYFGGYLKLFDKAQIKRYFDKGLQIAKRDCQRGEKSACEMIRYKYEPLCIDIDSKYLPKIADDWEYLAYSFSWELEYFNDCMKKYAKHCDEILLTISNLCDKGEDKYCVAKGLIIFIAENENKGIGILQKSCDSGYATACAVLGNLFMPYPPPNAKKSAKKIGAEKRKKGIQYNKKACDLGLSSSCAIIVSRYFYGEFQHLDKKQIKLYFDKGLQIATRDCQRGEKTACEMIRYQYEPLQSKIDLMQ